MAVAYYTEFSDADPALAQQVAAQVNQKLGNNPPEGGIYHAEGPLSGGGWWTFNVWESEAIAEQFFADILRPALQSVGAPQGQPRMLAVHWESNHP